MRPSEETEARRMKQRSETRPCRRNRASKLDAVPNLDAEAAARGYSPDALAAMARISKRQLRRRIFARTGQRIHDWLDGLKLDWANGELRENCAVRIREIAAALGYSPSGFARAYRRRFMMSPREARAAGHSSGGIAILNL
jgi:transcriptional regulator GlxA family with amidase domain